MIHGLAGEEISTRPFQLVTGRMGRRSAFGGERGEIPLDLFIPHTRPLEAIDRSESRRTRATPGSSVSISEAGGLA